MSVSQSEMFVLWYCIEVVCQGVPKSYVIRQL